MVTETQVKTAIKKCMRHLRKKNYEMKLTPEDTKRILSDLKVYKRENGRSSAGRSSIKICTTCWQFGNKRWTEYKSFNKHPAIGAIEVNDDEDILMCLVAHEVAHYVQYTFITKMPQFLRNKDTSPHGERFKMIYEWLRRDLVNPTIQEKKRQDDD